MVNLRELKLLGEKVCNCGYEFTANDISNLVKNEDYQFYGGRVNYYSEIECPNCHNKQILLLEAYNNSYRVIDIGEIPETASGIEQILEESRENF